MGKARKSKSHVAKPNPTGLPEPSEFDDDGTTGPVETMLEQVQSPRVDDQLSGLQLLATLTENRTHVMSIMQTDVIRIVGPFLAVQNNPSLRLATVGALRNLSTCGVEVCDALFEQDLMTPLLALLQEYSTTDWQPQTVTSGVNTLKETFLSAVHLLSNLCESSSDALETFNNIQGALLPSILRCLDWKKYTLEVSVAVAQLLLIVSEDNSSTYRLFHDNEAALVSLLTVQEEKTEEDQEAEDAGFGAILLSTLATGILSNVPALAQQHLSAIMIGLDRPFKENHRSLLNSLSSEIPLVERAKHFEEPEIRNEDDEEVDMEMEEEEQRAANQRERDSQQSALVEKRVKNIGYLMEAQRVAAEILTNICSQAEEEKEAMDGDGDMSEDEAEEVQDFEGDGEQVVADKLPVEVLEAIRSLNLVEKLWQRAQPIAENVHEILRKYEGGMLVKKLKLLRVSCLLCLHNLCNVMTTDDLGGAQGIYKVWLDVGQQIFQGANGKGDAHLLEASTALMRATLEHLKGHQKLFAGMSQEDLEMILQGVAQCGEAEIRANWLRILGTLGCLLPEPLVKGIIEFLLESSAKEEEDAWTISEAMDALMDMFADNDWPEVAVQVNLGARVRQLERVLKNKLRQQKRELGERYAAVATVRQNLVRFAKYVDTEVAKKAKR